MIRHVVAWRIAATDEATRAEHIRGMVERLRSLPPLIPVIRSFQVGENVAFPDRNFDIVLIADYDSLDDLQAYAVHPEHEKIAEYIRAVTSDRTVVDFTL